MTTSNTMVLGTNAVTVKVPGNLSVANTFSANALDSSTIYKIAGNRVFHLTGTDSTFVGFESGDSITTGGYNAFFGTFAGKKTTTGSSNSFFGSYAGRDNSTGIGNSFFGANAGLSNNSSFNAFFGSGSGLSNINGANNSYFGYSTGANNSTGDNNSFFGSNAGKSTDNSSFNSFFGSFTGEKTTTGAGNTFFGAFAGRENTIGFNNTFVGYKAGQTPTTGNGNVVIGYNSSVANGVSNSIAIGQNIQVSQSNTIYIGNNISETYISGETNLNDVSASSLSAFSVSTSSLEATGGSIESLTTKSLTVNAQFSGNPIVATFNGRIVARGISFGQANIGGNTPLCMRNSGLIEADYDIIPCSSSIRYKENIENFTRGMELVNRLRPVTFNWKTDGSRDVGFIAEEVNEIEPLLNNYNSEGKIEGVRYAQITTALVNAVKEQQTQIETEKAENQKLQAQLKQQQAQIDALKSLVCQQNATAAVCAAPKEK